MVHKKSDLPAADASPDMDSLVSSYLHSLQAQTTIVVPQFKHRLALAKAWNITKGSHVLDVGCGQGESTLVLAQTVGPDGRVTGIDTAPPEYGGPFTVAEAQGHIIQSIYGERINFLRTDAASLLSKFYRGPTDLLPQSTASFDCAVFCHSLWYFGDIKTIASLFRDLARADVRRVYVADYSYQASLPEQLPHVLASRAQALLHALKAPRQTGVVEPNVRAAPEPVQVVEIAHVEGYKLLDEGWITPDADLRDGHFEAKYVQMELFCEHITREQLSDEAARQVLALVPEVKRAYDETSAQGHEFTRTMDVWWAVFALS